ncbi:right-handed parallel beta-helix repeat-containing protein [bacterium]|nr:right-handed parallel beta-helix repeat-containing protein [bacterium]
MKFSRWSIVCLLMISACAGATQKDKSHQTSAAPAGREITVDGFDGAAIQAAVDRAAPGDVVFLPAGDYLCSRTVTVKTPNITIRGAARLQNVCVVEPGPEDTPPTWDAIPSRCFASPGNLNQVFFAISADGVALRDLVIEGNITHTMGRGIAINAVRQRNLLVDGCELKRHMIGVSITDSTDSLVRDCYIHENYRNGMGYGVMPIGRNMMTGGSSVRIVHNEFTLQRHDIASNSPQTWYLAENNYFHDNDMSQNQPSVDTHPQGQMTLTCIVRDNIFENCTPGSLRAGPSEWTGNTFEQSRNKRRYLVSFGIPAHNGRYIPNCTNHDQYFGENDNRSGVPIANVQTWNFPPVKWSAYSLFIDGELWEAKHTEHPAYAEGTRPMVGHMFWTKPGDRKEINEIEPAKPYDLHVMAVDPQGFADIKEIGVQIRAEATRYTPGNDDGVYDAAGNLYFKATPKSLSARKKPGSGKWSRVGLPLLSKPSWKQNGTHRVELTMRVTLPTSVKGPQWRLQGYAIDNEGNKPIEAWYEKQEGWKFSIIR